MQKWPLIAIAILMAETHAQPRVTSTRNVIEQHAHLRSHAPRELHGLHALHPAQHAPPRRLIAGVPDALPVIKVPCNTSDTCNHGMCRNAHCLCDNGWYTAAASRTVACNAEAKSQVLAAVMQYLFGYFGVGAFILGWTAWGVTTLVLFFLTICCKGRADSAASRNDNETACCAATIYATTGCALFVIWIVMAITISTKCVDSNGIKCKAW